MLNTAAAGLSCKHFAVTHHFVGFGRTVGLVFRAPHFHPLWRHIGRRHKVTEVKKKSERHELTLLTPMNISLKSDHLMKVVHHHTAHSQSVNVFQSDFMIIYE